MIWEFQLIAVKVKTAIINFLLISIPTILVLVLILELVLRFVIPASNPPLAYFDESDQILKFDQSHAKGTRTFGNLAQVRGKWEINNYGWNSAIDYFPDRRSRPLIAIIGDSYVEALQVDLGDQLTSHIRQSVGDKFDVYSFGISGAAISQYLHMSRYVDKNFDPDVLLFIIVHNDFKQSLCVVTSSPGYMCLKDEGPELQESIIPYTPSSNRRWARKSSLIRYMIFNLQLIHLVDGNNVGKVNRIPNDQPINVLPKNPLENRVDRAMDYVFGRISDENPDTRVIFMIDGVRSSIYAGNPEASFNDPRNLIIKDKSLKYGFDFIDLAHEFAAEYSANQLRFESKYDRHWNEHGHRVAAKAFIKTLEGTRPAVQ